MKANQKKKTEEKTKSEKVYWSNQNNFSSNQA